MIIMIASTNSHTWAKMCIKRDRFLGKFKKGPPHIGEYEKKVHFQGGRCNDGLSRHNPSEYKNIIKYKYQNTKIRKIRKYISKK